MSATPNPAPPAKGRFADPATLMRIRTLELRARIVVEGFWRGLHRSPYHGYSSEFTEYRQYVIGDDLRYLDWKLLARSDRYYVRKFEEDTNAATFLILDRSRSMEFGAAGYTKSDYARTLTATLALFLQQQGDAVGLLTFAERVEDYVPPKNSRRHLIELMAHLEKSAIGVATALAAPLEQILRTVTRRGLVVLISDFLSPLDQLESRLAGLAACGHDISLFQIMDRAEIDFPYDASAIFEDLESGEHMPIHPSVREGYLKRLHAHLDALKALCLKYGIIHHLFPTDEHLEKALFEHLSDRAGRRRLRTSRV